MQIFYSWHYKIIIPPFESISRIYRGWIDLEIGDRRGDGLINRVSSGASGELTKKAEHGYYAFLLVLLLSLTFSITLLGHSFSCHSFEFTMGANHCTLVPLSTSLAMLGLPKTEKAAILVFMSIIDGCP